MPVGYGVTGGKYGIVLPVSYRRAVREVEIKALLFPSEIMQELCSIILTNGPIGRVRKNSGGKRQA